jgi:hypothetical protein
MDSLTDIYWILLLLPKLNFQSRYFIGLVEVEYNYVFFLIIDVWTILHVWF